MINNKRIINERIIYKYWEPGDCELSDAAIKKVLKPFLEKLPDETIENIAIIFSYKKEVLLTRTAIDIENKIIVNKLRNKLKPI